MNTVQVSPPRLDLAPWRADDGQREATLLLPHVGTCSTLLLDKPDEYGVSCWLVAGIAQREGKRYRSSAECQLAPDLLVEYGNIREDEEVSGGWARVEGMAAPVPTRNFGLLTRATGVRLEYGGERVDPMEGCTGVDLLGCANTELPVWQECRACDKTALFFQPRPVVPNRTPWPICLSECPRPPHEQLLAAMGDLGLWRLRADPRQSPTVFSSAADCDAELKSRGLYNPKP